MSLLTFFSLVLTLTLVMWNNDEVLGGESISVWNLSQIFCKSENFQKEKFRVAKCCQMFMKMK